MRNGALLAAWAFVAVALLGPIGGVRADDEPEGESVAIENKVRLEIQFTGLSAEGAKVEIKPAHPGCTFETKTVKIAKGLETKKLDPIVLTATSTAADRDCSFEIVLTEPGRKPKVFRRGLQLTAPTEGVASGVRTLKCYLPATALAARDTDKTRPRR